MKLVPVIFLMGGYYSKGLPSHQEQIKLMINKGLDTIRRFDAETQIDKIDYIYSQIIERAAP